MRGGVVVLVLVFGQVGLGVGVVLLPWAGNAISGSSSAAGAGIGTGGVVAFVLAVVGALGLQLVAAFRRWRVGARVAGLVCSLGAVLLAVSFVVTVRGSTVRAYGVDSAGRVSEPAAQSHPGAGLWCAIALGLVALGVHALPLLAGRRRPA
jgi:hypothetical protein